MKKEITNSLHASAVGALATFDSSVPTNWKQKHQGQHTEVLFARANTDITAMSPQRRINGNIPAGYLG
jgi:hypothetical protein